LVSFKIVIISGGKSPTLSGSIQGPGSLSEAERIWVFEAVGLFHEWDYWE